MNTIQELNPHNFKTNQAIGNNLQILFERLIEFQDALGKEITLTSGLRSEQEQVELIKAGKTNARYSKHCVGAAADILDEDGSIGDFVKNNLDLMEKIGFWMEEFSYTKGWVHVQIMAPLSGKRVFIP